MSAVEYVSRLRSLVEGKDPIAVQTETPAALARLITSVPQEKLNRPPAPGKWSCAAIVAHLAEAEIALSWRYRQIAEKEGAALSGYDQNLWYHLGDYESRDLQESLAQFRLLRQANLRMFDRLTPEDWLRSGIHSERGRLTMKDLVAQAAGHDLSHLQQVERAIAAVSE
ncbi:MAG: DinB family protein [Acidobacteriaceae bacterium]|nr:DinB family protein [Acidobacteriaceae bacterium]